LGLILSLNLFEPKNLFGFLMSALQAVIPCKMRMSLKMQNEQCNFHENMAINKLDTQPDVVTLIQTIWEIMKKLPFLCLAIILSGMNAFCQSNYSVLDYWKYYSDAENTLYKMQTAYAFDLLNQRKAEIAQLQTKEDWKRRQEKVKRAFEKALGTFPEKKPLNPVITGKLQGDGFTVEKLYFESLPGYKVTAALFLPKGKKRKLPTIIYCSGHSDLAFRSDVYQHVIINLVLKGFAVFAFDPIGQGERQQYFIEAEGKSKFRPTHEHSYPGAQLFINGSSAAYYMIWDGIRSVDYLLTRKEIDPERIGITGRSGGGTQSSYIAAMDERIKAAAPECYITSFEYLLKSNGPQDAEQNFYHGIKEGIDLADLLQVRAPQPTMMITTTRDIFSIQGAREVSAETRPAFGAYGSADHFEMVEDDAGHASTLKNREAMYAFFQKHLENHGSSKDQEVERFPVEELYITTTGQLSTSIGSKFLFDLNFDLSHQNAEKLGTDRRGATSYIQSLPSKVKTISGFQASQTADKLVFSGRTDMEGYFLEKYLLEQGNDFAIPFLVFTPKSKSNQTVLYLDDIKEDNGNAHRLPTLLASSGISVIVPHLPGYGSLGPGYLKGDAYFSNTSYNQWFAGILNGRSTVALHAAVIQRILHHIALNKSLENSNMVGISKGGFNSSLLHTATLGVEFDKMIFIEPLLSFEALTRHREYAPYYIPFTVAGALPHYDLPDLVAGFAPRPIVIVNGKDHIGALADRKSVTSAYGFAIQQYEVLNEAENFSVTRDLTNEQILDYVMR
jgi:hypothetical protein